MVDSALPDSSESCATGKKEYIAIATVGRPVGLSGWCRIITFGRTLEKVKIPFTLTAGLKYPKEEVILRELRQDAKGYKGLFKGYDTREEIESLKNSQLFIEKEKLPVAGENEYYHFELEGIDVFSRGNDKYIGKVNCVHNYPTVDALEVGKEDGSSCILPMTEQVIERIDKKNRKIYIFDAAIEELL